MPLQNCLAIAASRAMMVRTARPEDIPQLLRLIRDHAQYEGGRATIDKCVLDRLLRVEEPPVRILVAESDQIAGYAALTTDYSLWSGARYGHLDCLFVAKEYRGTGVGQKLFLKVREEAHAAGCVRLEWQTPDWNSQATEFYRRNGAECLSKTRFILQLDAG